jgi:hypothetical protein
VKTPTRPSARARKGAGKAAAVKHPPVGTPTTQVRAAYKGGTKRRTKAPSPAPPTGMQLHTANGARKYLTAGERVLSCGKPTWPIARCGYYA